MVTNLLNFVVVIPSNEALSGTQVLLSKRGGSAGTEKE